jgi:hypothetical protein
MVGVPAIVNGDEVSSAFSAVTVDYLGYVTSPLETPGSNWAGWLWGTGEVNFAYSVELDVTYSPAPEPSTFALLGTGLLGLAGAARRKLTAYVSDDTALPAAM